MSDNMTHPLITQLTLALKAMPKEKDGYIRYEDASKVVLRSFLASLLYARIKNVLEAGNYKTLLNDLDQLERRVQD